MTVIYVDTLFFLNAVVDYLLLLASARLAGEPLKRLRFGLGAVLGGGYAVALFLPGGGFLAHPLCRAAAVLLLLVVSYGGSARLLRQSVIFLALTCAFGGGLVAVGLLGGQGLSMGEVGVLYAPLDLKMVLLSAAACYAVVTLVFQRMGRHTGVSGELLPARVTLGERSVEFTVLMDTGNTLTDPVTGQPVMVTEGEALGELFPKEYRPTTRDLCDPAGALSRLAAGEWKRRFRLLPYRSVGVARGLLLAVKTDRVVLDGVDRGGMLVALSPTPVSDGGGYRALVGPLVGKGGTT